MKISHSKYLKDGLKRVHFIGIGGIGMSGLAEYLLEKGYIVSGSDMTGTFITERMSRKGARIYYGHDEANLDKRTGLVVYTSAVKKNNPEFIKAKQLGISTIKRAALLGDIVNDKYLIAVSGTHGKTTTTSILSKIFIDLGYDPTVFVGGNLDILKGKSFKSGTGDLAIVEADEYDKSFLTLHPDVMIINNVELDHVDIYKNEESLLSTFAAFTRNIKEGGTFVLNWDDSNIRKLFKKAHKNNDVIKYGIKSTGRITNLQSKNFKTGFCLDKSKILLKLLGRHNVYNAAAAISAASVISDDIKSIIKSVSSFSGVKRRLELKYSNGLTIFDDYAHHPTEIKTTLESLKQNGKGRLTVVFQPHTYSRTQEFYREFAEALKSADSIYLVPVYPAREKPIKGVNSELILKILKKSKKQVQLSENKEDLFLNLRSSLRRNDKVVFQGAGTITNLCDEFVNIVKKR